MKKYKCIKAYPGTTVGKETHDSWEGTEQSLNNFPEFWEEIPQLEYEIVTFTDTYNDYSKTKEGLFTINTVYHHKEEVLLKREDIKIKRVKRLSDGQIFTLGDKVKHIEADYIYTIKNIKIHKVFYTRNSDLTWKYIGKNQIYIEEHDQKGAWLNSVNPYNVLFTTVDGVDIYLGDTFFIVNRNFRVQQCTGGHFQKERWDKYRFSSREQADKYVERNKPCLCLMDFETALNSIGYLNADQSERFADFSDKLKEILRKKL